MKFSYCPLRKVISAHNWLRTYTDREQYLGNCKTEDQLWLLAEGMAEDAFASGYCVGVSEMFDELLDQWWELHDEVKE